jgi:hypothetical protein
VKPRSIADLGLAVAVLALTGLGLGWYAGKHPVRRTTAAADSTAAPVDSFSSHRWQVGQVVDDFSGDTIRDVMMMSDDNNAAITIFCKTEPGRGGSRHRKLFLALGLLTAHIFDSVDDGITMKVRKDEQAATDWQWTVSEGGQNAFMRDANALRSLPPLHRFRVQLNLYAAGYQTATFTIPNGDVLQHFLTTCK